MKKEIRKALGSALVALEKGGVKKFEVNCVYTCREYTFEIVKRTAKYVTFNVGGYSEFAQSLWDEGKEYRAKVEVHLGREEFKWEKAIDETKSVICYVTADNMEYSGKTDEEIYAEATARAEEYNKAQEIEASEYVVSVEAQDAAIESEIENAVSEKEESTNTPIETVDTVSAENVVKFEVGKTYIAKKHTEDAYYTHYLEVTRRTAKTVTFKDEYGHLFKGVRFQASGKCEYASGGFGYVFSKDESKDTREEMAEAFIKERDDEIMTEYAYDAVRLMFDEIQDMAIQLDEDVNIWKLPEKTFEDSLFEAVQSEIENAASEEVAVKSDITAAAIAQVEKVQEVSAADLEYLLKGYKAEIETHKAEMAHNVKVINAWKEAIIEYIATIMKGEDIITNLGVEIMEAKAQIEWLEEETAKINAKLLSREFNGSALIESIKAAEKVQSVAGVNFDLQQFSEVVIVGSAATIDTAVSKTEVPYIEDDSDEEAEEEPARNYFEAGNEKLREYGAVVKKYDEEIAEIEEEMEALNKRLNELELLRVNKMKMRSKAEKLRYEPLYRLQRWTREILGEELQLGEKEITLKAGEKQHTIHGDNGLDELDTSVNEKAEITLELWRRKIKLAKYKTIVSFKAAIRELGAAIERGDSHFTFPADK